MFSISRSLYLFFASLPSSPLQISWTSQKNLFAMFICLSCMFLHCFPLVHYSIRPYIQRYDSTAVFEKYDSFVYVLWSPFSRDFYVGSVKRKNPCSPFERFSEHMRHASVPSASQFDSMMYRAIRKHPGNWCIGLLDVNVENARDSERFFIKKLHPPLNTIHKTKPLSSHHTRARLPARFRTALGTPQHVSNIPSVTNYRTPALFSTVSCHLVPTTSLTHDFFTTCFDNIVAQIIPRTSQPFLFIPGYAIFCSVRHSRLLYFCHVTVHPLQTAIYTNFFGFLPSLYTNTTHLAQSFVCY